MSGTKEFLALVSKDKDVKTELAVETVVALRALLAEKGLNDEAQKAIQAIMVKVAKAHGFNLNTMEELDEEELKAVAGGSRGELIPRDTPQGPYCEQATLYGPGCKSCDHVNCGQYLDT